MPVVPKSSGAVQSAGLYPFENAPIVRPSICLDAVSFASTYPNWATIANNGGTCAIRSLSAGGIVVAQPSNITTSTQIFAASTEGNIPTTKTFANIGSLPSGLSAGYISAAKVNIFWCPITSKYYVGFVFYDSNTGNYGAWIFSIDPATGTSVLLLNIAGTSYSNTGVQLAYYLGGGDGTNFVVAPNASSTTTGSYYAITSTTVVTASGALPGNFSRYNPLSASGVNFVQQFSGQPFVVGNTKLWNLAQMYEGGGNNSLLLQGLAKWGGGAPPAMSKLVGKGTGSLIGPTLPLAGKASFFTGSATANAYDAYIFDTSGYVNGFTGLLL